MEPTICRFWENWGFCRCPPAAVQGNIERGTAKHRAVDVRKLPGINAQLRVSDDGIHAHIHERRQGDGSGDGESVFQIRDQAGIPTGENNPLDRYRNRVGAAQRIVRILGDRGAIRVGQRD